MAKRREAEEGGEGARRWSSGGLYRPRSSWVWGVASGGGGFGPGWLIGGLAEGAAALRLAGVAWQLGSASGTRVSVGWCQGAGQVALEGSPGPLGRGAPWTRSTGGIRRATGENRASREERDGGEGISAISENPGASR